MNSAAPADLSVELPLIIRETMVRIAIGVSGRDRLGAIYIANFIPASLRGVSVNYSPTLALHSLGVVAQATCSIRSILILPTLIATEYLKAVMWSPTSG